MEQIKTKLKRLITLSILAMSVLEFLNCKVIAQTVPSTLVVTANEGALSPVNYCVGTNLTLTAIAGCQFYSGANGFSYLWSGGPGTVTSFNTFAPTPTVSTIYSVTATPTFTLSGSACDPVTTTFTVIVKPVTPTVIQTPNSVCTGSNISLLLENIPGAPNSYTVGWSTSIDQGSSMVYSNPSPSFLAYPPTTYTVNFTSSDPGGCTGSLNGNFTINTTACNAGTIHNSPALTSYGGGTVSIQNDVDVVSNVVISGTNVLISPGKTITVKPGVSLTLKGSWLHGCSCPWNGIIVEPGAKLVVIEASVIEDANTAITIQTGTAIPVVKLEKSIINKCGIGVSASVNSTTILNGNFTINQCIFTCRNINSSTLYSNMTNFTALHSDFLLTPDLNTASSTALSLSNNIDNIATRATLPSGERTSKGLAIFGHSNATLKPFTNTLTLPSIFDNMDFGIYADVSSLHIEAAHFMNLEGNNTGEMVNGIGIYSIDPKNSDLTSELIVKNCFMNNACRGIHLENIVRFDALTNILSSDKTFTNYNTSAKDPGQYGIYYSFFARTSAGLTVPTEWTIRANSIRNYNYGVAILRNNYIGTSINKFNCNTIFGGYTNPGTSFCNIGLYIDDGVGSGAEGAHGGPDRGQADMYGNAIVYVKTNAIKMNNVHQNFYIQKNKNDYLSSGSAAFAGYIVNWHGPLGFALRDNSSKASTIFLTECSNIYMQFNTIYGWGQSGNYSMYNTTGIFCIKSNVVIAANTIRNNKNDISFSGDCNPSKIGLNTFAYATNAMFFGNDAQIGNQGAPGSPCGSKFVFNPTAAKVLWQTNVANANANVAPAASSTFYYRNFGNGSTTEKMTNNRQTYTSPGIPLYVYNNGFGGGLIGGHESAGGIPEPIFECGAPSPSPPGGGGDNPGVLKSRADSVEYIKKLILDNLPDQAYASEKWWNNKLHALRTIESNVNDFIQDPVINSFYTNNQSTDLGKLNRVYAYAEAGQTQIAENINSSISGIEPNENYRKAVNHIHLSMVNDSLYVMDSSAIQVLEIIANACADQLGKVVYEARNLLMGHKKQVLEFNDGCNAISNNRIVNLDYEVSTEKIMENMMNFSLFPNPNNGTFTLVNKLSKSVSGKLRVCDVLGKTVMELEVENSVEIEVNLNKALYGKGIYFVRLTDENNKLLYIGKTIVQ